MLVSHPMCVPVSPTTSRRKCTSNSRGSTSRLCSTPLIRIETFFFGTSSIGVFPLLTYILTACQRSSCIPFCFIPFWSLSLSIAATVYRHKKHNGRIVRGHLSDRIRRENLRLHHRQQRV